MNLVKQSLREQSKNFAPYDFYRSYYNRPRYITFDEQQKLLKQGFTSDLEFNNAVESKFMKRLNLMSATSTLFNPITESQRKNTKDLVDAQERARLEFQQKFDKTLENQNEIMKKALEYKGTQSADNQFGAVGNLIELEDIEDTKNMVNKYLNNLSRDELFGLAEFKDDTIKFGCVDLIDKYNFLLSTHYVTFDYEIKKIYVTREDVGEQREYRLTENLMRYLTIDVEDIQDENAKKEYLEMIKYAIGPELNKIKSAGKSQNRKLILNEFRNNRKFEKLIAPIFGIKSLSYDDRLKPADGLGYTRTIVLPPNANAQMKRLMVLLGTKQSLGKNVDENVNIGLEEFTALLDQLLKTQKINKLTYKTLLQKYYKS